MDPTRLTAKPALVGFVLAHKPAPDHSCVGRRQADVVLLGQNRHVIFGEFGELGFGRALPQPDKEIDANRLVFRRQARLLQPHPNRKVGRIISQAILMEFSSQRGAIHVVGCRCPEAKKRGQEENPRFALLHQIDSRGF
jgi:hypothetical protein